MALLVAPVYTHSRSSRASIGPHASGNRRCGGFCAPPPPPPPHHSERNEVRSTSLPAASTTRCACTEKPPHRVATMQSENSASRTHRPIARSPSRSSLAAAAAAASAAATAAASAAAASMLAAEGGGLYTL